MRRRWAECWRGCRRDGTARAVGECATIEDVDFENMLDDAVLLFEAAGVAILVFGGLISVVAYIRDLSRGDRRAAYTALRHNMGRTILLGLEVLIVADIILTVAIDQTLQSAATLGLIVLVRTFLSFSLDIEMDGVPPWRRLESERAAERVQQNR